MGPVLFLGGMMLKEEDVKIEKNIPVPERYSNGCWKSILKKNENL